MLSYSSCNKICSRFFNIVKFVKCLPACTDTNPKILGESKQNYRQNKLPKLKF